MRVIACTCGVAAICAAAIGVYAYATAPRLCFAASASAPAPAALYDPDPGHLWNRIHQRFRVRVARDGSEYGFDTVDPLLWAETRYLLTEPSHAAAVQLLDEFLESNGEQLIRDPLKRAVFQHDLWAVFDWLVSVSDRDRGPKAALMRRVARVIRRVALTQKEVAALPDNYAEAIAGGSSLPRDLFDPAGAWVSIGGTQPIAAQHASELGRSAFIVLWSLPGGSQPTRAFLQQLWNVPQPFVRDQSFTFAQDGELRTTLSSALPPVPDGTRIALVRKMLLIDGAGHVSPSKVVQGIQLRTFPSPKGFSEDVMSRIALFAGKAGGLRSVAVDERGFLTFSAHPIDPFESDSGGRVGGGRILDGCPVCHQVTGRPSIETVRSVNQLLRPQSFVDTRHERWSRWFDQPTIAAHVKTRSYEWGVLQGLWHSEPR